VALVSFILPAHAPSSASLKEKLLETKREGGELLTVGGQSTANVPHPSHHLSNSRKAVHRRRGLERHVSGHDVT